MKGDFMKKYWSERLTKEDGSKESMKEYSARVKGVAVCPAST